MKILIILMILLPCFSQASSRCYIINESKIEHRTHQVKGALNERCPSNLNNIQDLTYVKQQTTLCINKADCYAKAVNLCTPTLANPNGFGRLIVASDFSEIYCVKPILDNAKKETRLAAEASSKATEDIKRAGLKTNRALLKAAYLDIDSLKSIAELKQYLKRLTRHVLRE